MQKPSSVPKLNEVEEENNNMVSSNLDLNDYNGMIEEEKEVQHWRIHDSIRKFQIDSDEHITLTPKYPEKYHIEKQEIGTVLTVIGLGEGKIL